MKSSKGSGVISVRSKAPTAFAKFATVTGSLSAGKAALNRATYSFIPFRTFSTDSLFGMPKAGGPVTACLAWSSTLVRFPIQ
jgi:hypothetical protein